MGRGKKYDIEETEKICLAYVQASNNPAVGSAQKADRFWAAVLQKLADLSPTDCPPGTYKHRSVAAIQCYLKENVFPSVNKFQKSLRRVHAANLTGGLAEMEKINIAVAMHCEL